MTKLDLNKDFKHLLRRKTRGMSGKYLYYIDKEDEPKAALSQYAAEWSLIMMLLMGLEGEDFE